MPDNVSRHVPTVTELISLPVPTAGPVSPDGRYVAYTIETANWRDNRYDSRCYVHDTESGRGHLLTRSGRASQPRWLGPRTLALLRSDPEAYGDADGAQVWLYEGLVGEGWQVTDHKGGVAAFEPLADGIVFKAPHPERSERKERGESFGTFVHKEREDSADALYYVSLPRLRAHLADLLACSSESQRQKMTPPVVELSEALPEPLAIVSFTPSPTGDALYLTCRERDDLVYLDAMRCYRLKVDPEEAVTEHLRLVAEKEAADSDNAGREKRDAGGGTGDGAAAGEDALEAGRAEGDSGIKDISHLGELTRLALPPACSLGPVAPGGDKVVVRKKLRDDKWYTQTDLLVVDVSGAKADLESGDLSAGAPVVTTDLDRSPLHVQWSEQGILVSVVSGTDGEIYLLADGAEPRPLDLGDVGPGPVFDAAPDGHLCFVGAGPTSIGEVYAGRVEADGSFADLQRLTDVGAAVADLDLGTVETIRWRSKDGTQIEGVLRKPSDFQEGRRYPLAFVVHGGPTWASREMLLDGDDLRYYPTVALASRGVLVLKPNYRGSLGRGQAFLELNAGNLGIGDLWDLESAIDALDERGLVDRGRACCMGWSQGGYISAMAATHSDRFRAVSVGAGISDWYTYHISNDIPQFTTHYLGASPFDDREIYRTTAPIEGLSGNTAPMLIQHGARDQRVPLSNAMELFRGLQDMDVPVELFVFPEMAHPITKPRENRAVMWQNLTWFAHHLLGDPLDFFRSPEEEDEEGEHEGPADAVSEGGDKE